jgi:serine/threonine protein kinase
LGFREAFNRRGNQYRYSSFDPDRTKAPIPLLDSPEVLTSSGRNSSPDIWSLGMTALELPVGKASLADLPALAATIRIPSRSPPEPPEGLSDLFKDFLRRMLLTDLAGRARATQLIEQPFAASADESESQLWSPLSSRPKPKRKPKQRRKRSTKNERTPVMVRTLRRRFHVQTEQRSKRFLLSAWTENEGDEWPGPN